MSKCKCGHEQGQHIYDEGLCRPGFICDCKSFSPAEPKCAECGDADHVGRECGATKFAGDEIGVCRCYRPAEPDATARARAFRESYDRTFENAKVWMGSHPWAFDVFEQKDGTTETEGEHYTRIMAAFLESETPRIKADAVREAFNHFLTVELSRRLSMVEVLGAVERTVKRYQVAKEMTEVD